MVRLRLRQRSHGSESQLRHVQLTEFDLSKVNPENLLIHLLEADIFEGEDLADEHTVFVPADIATGVDPSSLKASLGK
jgi:hypothetical protein